MSFYRFPTKAQIERWRREGSGLKWCIKVHRSITHTGKLGKDSVQRMEEFMEHFRPMDSFISFYLLQFPSSFGPERYEELDAFLSSLDSSRVAVELRNQSWDAYAQHRVLKGCLVSPDSPFSSGKVACLNGTVYLRFHGRKRWYAYRYTDRELKEVASLAIRSKPRQLFAFFNNDEAMLDNARYFARAIAEQTRTGRDAVRKNNK